MRATLRLISAHTHARWYRLRYDDVGTFLADQRTLMAEGRFHHLEGQIKPVDGTWVPYLDGVSYFTPLTEPAQEHLLAGLNDQRDAMEISDHSYHGFQNRSAEDVALLRTSGPWQHPHLWINLLLPDHATESLVTNTLTTLTSHDIGDTDVILLYPVPRARITTPRFRLPIPRPRSCSPCCAQHHPVTQPRWPRCSPTTANCKAGRHSRRHRLRR